MADLPHFVIIGAMKAGTSTLYAWLTEHAGAPPCAQKEPAFFALDDVWRRGVDWYQGQFAPGPAPYRGGEASTVYSQPDYAEIAAARMRDVVPDVRLVYVVREPLARLRSHYRHDVLTARERNPFSDAIRSNPQIVGASCYASRLAPYLAAFPRDQILVVVFEELFGDSDRAWLDVLEHLGLPPVPRPASVHNATEGKRAESLLKRWLVRRGARRAREYVPPALWRLGSRALKRVSRQGSVAAALLDDEMVIPDDVRERLDDEAAKLATLLGRDALWPSTR